ncbi:hypothetical protein V494_01514 [Pseudogymnoascus sp. VKM F-4513 (FW-928)]|nr:hypothetical protein V494_01514 [Pseudogymnoascus sp. VKM F-4513 (FW-928)]
MRSSAPEKAVKMPYNTRRKSLSLPSLGIHLPVTHASRAAAAAAAANRSPPSSTPPSDQPPLKKLKQSHASSKPQSQSPSSQSQSHMSPPSKPEPAAKSILKYEHTPPPSPEADQVEEDAAPRREIDLEGINDDIVEAVIVQLQRTANRPHLVKELAAILSTSVKIVETSANPSAIISSRLSTYLKRSCWSALAPCPLAKELETVHPRRTYFYLTTYRHQPIPSPSQAASASAFPQRSIISPSLSSTESRSDEADAERRRQLSPSPEVDLSSPELDDVGSSDSNGSVAPPTPSGSFSGRLTRGNDAGGGLARNHRAASPPLEKDEKEFTQTARGMQRRQLQSEKLRGEGAAAAAAQHIPSFSFVGDGSEGAVKIMDLDGDLFGEHEHHARGGSAAHGGFVSSPAMKPMVVVPGIMTSSPASMATLKRPFEDVQEWSRDDMEWDSRSPENIDLDELDGMFDCFE